MEVGRLDNMPDVLEYIRLRYSNFHDKFDNAPKN